MDLAIDKFSPERFGLITGSMCYVLFPVRSAAAGQDTYARQLANQLYFQTYDEVSSWQTEHGEMNEPNAFEHYQQYYDKNVTHGCWAKKGDCGGTSDALCELSGVDFKCPTTLEAWIDYLHDGISRQQYYQCQMYMHLFGKDTWQVAAFLTETQRMTDFGLTYPVPHKDRMIITEVKKEQGWSELLQERAEPIIKKRDEYYSVLESRFGMKQKTLHSAKVG